MVAMAVNFTIPLVLSELLEEFDELVEPDEDELEDEDELSLLVDGCSQTSLKEAGDC